MASQQLPGKLPVVLVGDSSVLVLVHRAVSLRALRKDRALVLLDCGGQFDPYLIAQEARMAGAIPEEVLGRLLVCRAFTGYQQLHALRQLSRFAAGQQIYVLNPLHLLLDEDLPVLDRPWLFRQLLAGLEWLSGHGHTVRVCQTSVSGSPLPEATSFEAALTKRYPVLVATAGRLQQGSDHGKVGIPVQPRDRSRRGDVRSLPTRAA